MARSRHDVGVCWRRWVANETYCVRPRVSHSQCRSSPKAPVVSLGCHKQFLALKSPRRSISSWGLSTSFMALYSSITNSAGSDRGGR